MSKVPPIYLRYCGLKIRLELGRKSLRDALATVLRPFLTGPQKSSDLETTLVEKTRFQKAHSRWFSGLEKIGRRVFRRGRRIYVEKCVDFPGVSFLVDRRTRALKMTVLAGSGFAEKCRDVRTVFQSFPPYFCYYPAFWLLAQRKKIFPLHGGGVAYKKRGVIFAGLQGVGKSTLLLRMLRHPSARFLSDNVYLHNRNRVFACLETIRLDDASVRFIGGVDGILEATKAESDYGRRMYVVEQNKFTPGLKPHLMIVPSFAERTHLVRIAPNRAAQLCLNFNELALELRAYQQFVAPFNFFEDARDRYQDQYSVLMDFLKKLDIYELKIKPDGRTDRAMSLIEKALGV